MADTQYRLKWPPNGKLTTAPKHMADILVKRGWEIVETPNIVSTPEVVATTEEPKKKDAEPVVNEPVVLSIAVEESVVEAPDVTLAEVQVVASDVPEPTVPDDKEPTSEGLDESVNTEVKRRNKRNTFNS